MGGPRALPTQGRNFLFPQTFSWVVVWAVFYISKIRLRLSFALTLEPSCWVRSLRSLGSLLPGMLPPSYSRSTWVQMPLGCMRPSGGLSVMDSKQTGHLPGTAAPRLNSPSIPALQVPPLFTPAWPVAYCSCLLPCYLLVSCMQVSGFQDTWVALQT